MSLPEIKEFRRPMGPPEHWTTEGFLDELRHRYDAKTDYALHKLLKVSRQTIYRYRDGKGTFDEDIAVRAAELLGLDPQMMLVWVTKERTRHAQARIFWEDLLKKLAGPAAVVLLAILVTEPLFNESPLILVDAGQCWPLCIM